MSRKNEIYPKIVSVTPLSNDHLRVTFVNHIIKEYDCSPILQHPEFSMLHDPAIFRAVHVDQGGYGVSWNDGLDVSESELWLHGTRVELSQEETPSQQQNQTQHHLMSA